MSKVEDTRRKKNQSTNSIQTKIDDVSSIKVSKQKIYLL